MSLRLFRRGSTSIHTYTGGRRERSHTLKFEGTSIGGAVVGGASAGTWTDKKGMNFIFLIISWRCTYDTRPCFANITEKKTPTSSKNSSAAAWHLLSPVNSKEKMLWSAPANPPSLFACACMYVSYAPGQKKRGGGRWGGAHQKEMIQPKRRKTTWKACEKIGPATRMHAQRNSQSPHNNVR